MGSSGLLCYAITKILRNKEYKIISRNKKKNFIKTNIFNKKLNLIKIKKEKWINKINDNDCMILLNNFGKISDYQNYRNKVIDFEKRIFFVLKNIRHKLFLINVRGRISGIGTAPAQNQNQHRNRHTFMI